MKILIPALDRDDYADLSVLLASLRAYAPTVPILVAYKGRRPRLFGADFIEQPDDCTHFGDACRFLLSIKHTKSDEILCFLNDDTVILPDTLDLLSVDLAALDQMGEKVGLLGLRSNFIAGAQNIRIPQPGDVIEHLRFKSERLILKVQQVFGVGFAVRRSVLADVSLDWTHLHWYSDDLLSYDLAKKGYGHFISRGYLHHIGSRSGGEDKWKQWDEEAKQWILKHRPDFAAARGWKSPIIDSAPLITS